MKFDELEPVLISGLKYRIELNTSTEFRNAVYLGTKKINGKPIWIFLVSEKLQLGVNPSFHTYTLEEEIQMDEPVESDTETTNNKTQEI